MRSHIIIGIGEGERTGTGGGVASAVRVAFERSRTVGRIE
jgi:hypothetical protein